MSGCRPTLKWLLHSARGVILEVLLAISIATLVVQLCWPAIVSWYNRPHAGATVLQRIRLDEGGELAYLLRLPSSFEPAKSYPLVVFLHGSGDRGRNASILKRRPPMSLATRLPKEFVLVAPQCPPHQNWTGALVLPIIDKLSVEFSIDQERIYLTGFSMGGFGATSIAAEQPERFAAVVPVAGASHEQAAAKLASIPCWAFHGEMDDVVPISVSERFVKILASRGENVRLTVLPAARHGIDEVVYARADLWDWMLRQRKTARYSTN
jgi:predicted peptidase